MPVLNMVGFDRSEPPYAVYATIQPREWVNNRVTIQGLFGLDGNSTGEVTWAPVTLNDEKFPEVLLCGVKLYSQGKEYVVLSCDTPPTIPVAVMITCDEAMFSDYNGSSTAASSDIVEGRTAFINGEQVTGSLTEHLSGEFEPSVMAVLQEVPEGLEVGLEAQQDMVLRQSAGLKGTIPVSALGDAAPNDVYEGKTFTSASGLKKTGTVPVEGGSYQISNPEVLWYQNPALKFRSFVSSRKFIEAGTYIELTVYDVYQFGQARQEDVARGRTFTSANGLKIAGTVAAYDPHQGIPSFDGSIWDTSDTTYLTLIKTWADYPVMFRKEASLITRVRLSELGDATPGDVAIGKTFTSASGVRVIGTVPARKIYTSMDYPSGFPVVSVDAIQNVKHGVEARLSFFVEGLESLEWANYVLTASIGVYIKLMDGSVYEYSREQGTTLVVSVLCGKPPEGKIYIPEGEDKLNLAFLAEDRIRESYSEGEINFTISAHDFPDIEELDPDPGSVYDHVDYMTVDISISDTTLRMKRLYINV